MKAFSYFDRGGASKGDKMKGLALIGDIISRNEHDLLLEWITYQMGASTFRRDLISRDELEEQSREFLRLLTQALERNGESNNDIDTPVWGEVRSFLADLSRARAKLGFSPAETASFVFSLKQPIFDRLRKELARDPQALSDELWTASTVFDKMGLFTTEVHQKSREEIITRQQDEMLELSVPVVELWEGILALPLIGTVDSARSQVVMENLLEKIVDTGAAIAIIDITGVPMIDTLVAQHIMKTIAAAKLMGAECIISGIRPQIAQTIVHLGVDLSSVITKASLADAFAVALDRSNLRVARIANGEA
ncbi:MAG: STAS domain-containing protein [Candidatus Binataceae bacterium]